MEIKEHKELPDNAMLVTSGIQFYLLKDRKKILSLENIEIPLGLTYYVYSPLRECYYERIVNDRFDIKSAKLKDLIKFGRIYIGCDSGYNQMLERTLSSTNLEYKHTYEYIKALFLLEFYSREMIADNTKVAEVDRLKKYITHVKSSIVSNSIV